MIIHKMGKNFAVGDNPIDGSSWYQFGCRKWWVGQTKVRMALLLACERAGHKLKATGALGGFSESDRMRLSESIF